MLEKRDLIEKARTIMKARGVLELDTLSRALGTIDAAGADVIVLGNVGSGANLINAASVVIRGDVADAQIRIGNFDATNREFDGLVKRIAQVWQDRETPRVVLRFVGVDFVTTESGGLQLGSHMAKLEVAKEGIREMDINGISENHFGDRLGHVRLSLQEEQIEHVSLTSLIPNGIS